MAEAMAAGRPVIATGYSGNLAFMNEANSYLVDYKLTNVPTGCEPYPPNADGQIPPSITPQPSCDTCSSIRKTQPHGLARREPTCSATTLLRRRGRQWYDD